MTTPLDSHSKPYSHLGGTTAQVIDRLIISELCKGWPMYRDNSEWANFRSMFTDDAHIWTTWSTNCQIDEFIKISKQGKANGAFIMHRENSTLVELNQQSQRAVGKMKATITQRFQTTQDGTSSPLIYDVDCDCRYIFFCKKDTAHGGEWKVQFVKIIYEKDKVCSVDGTSVPHFSSEELSKYPDGYRYLGAAQARLGHRINTQLATLRDPYWSKMYECMENWLDGHDDPGLFWEHQQE